jgi:GxxExxY protein
MLQQGAQARSFGDGTEAIIGACIEVHRHLGPGLLESAYAAALARELGLRGIPFERQRAVSLQYKGAPLPCGLRLDFVVYGRVIVELKAVERTLPVHDAQAITYLKLAGLEVALLVNFNVPVLRHGLRRFVPSPGEPASLRAYV